MLEYLLAIILIIFVLLWKFLMIALVMTALIVLEIISLIYSNIWLLATIFIGIIILILKHS